MKKHPYRRKKTSTKKKKSRGQVLMIKFNVFIRRSRTSKKKLIDTMTHFDEQLCRQLAAAKNPNKWVSVQPIKK